MSTHTLHMSMKKPPMTANGQRRAHWTAVRLAKQRVETEVMWLAKGMIVQCPVEVSVTWYAPNARIRDSDSLGPFVKAALDGLVKADVIPGDDHRYVRRSGSSVVVDRDDPRMELQIIEVEAA